MKPEERLLGKRLINPVAELPKNLLRLGKSAFAALNAGERDFADLGRKVDQRLVLEIAESFFHRNYSDTKSEGGVERGMSVSLRPGEVTRHQSVTFQSNVYCPLRNVSPPVDRNGKSLILS